MLFKHLKPMLVVASLSTFLFGCGIDKILPAGTELAPTTMHTGSIPGAATDNIIVGTNCISAGAANGSILTVDCHAVLSNGVTDLANDLETGLSLLPGVSGWAEAKAAEFCTGAVRRAIATGVARAPAGDLRNLISNYVNQNNLNARAALWCRDAVGRAWDEISDNVYSTGTNCIVGKATIALTSVNLPPTVTFDAYPLPDTWCPRSDVYVDMPGFIRDLHWGRN